MSFNCAIFLMPMHDRLRCGLITASTLSNLASRSSRLILILMVTNQALPLEHRRLDRELLSTPNYRARSTANRVIVSSAHHLYNRDGFQSPIVMTIVRVRHYVFKIRLSLAFLYPTVYHSKLKCTGETKTPTLGSAFVTIASERN
jgi:hypothetical protein